MQRDLRGIAVLDVGATNAKALLFDPALNLLAEESVPSRRRKGPPYLYIDCAPVLAFVGDILPQFDLIRPVDAIVPCTHGSAAALVDEAGKLVLPVMSYEAEPPPEIVEGYCAIAPDFGEVFAPTNPLALTLARQLYWQETLFPEAFSRTSSIMPLAQYLAFRLCGARANEVSAMGAQTHLWAPMAKDYSRLAKERGWASRCPPIRPAWEVLGLASNLALRGAARVLTGVHDSNANLLLYIGDEPFTLLSTGTWIIGFAQGVDLMTLDPAFDQASNTTVLGDPIASCRFMGGREFEIVTDGAPAHLATSETVCDLLARGVAAWPSFTASGGPAPQTMGKGLIVGDLRDPRERASLASLYCAQMSALALRKIGSRNRVIVDGPFGDNVAYLEVLAACLPAQEIFASEVRNGTAVGAASLALPAGARAAPHKAIQRRIEAPRALSETAALASWFERIGRLTL
jgi:sugar (pentulose or hexulose) kinase